MVEYTSSPHAIREFMTSQERTAHWVQAHSSYEVEFYSPSMPPSAVDAYVPPSPPSPTESSHSLPPKMILRYGDGRPDIPIPRSDVPPGFRRKRDDLTSGTTSAEYLSRSGSHRNASLPRQNGYAVDGRTLPSQFPEEIRILPSQGSHFHRSTAASHHARSKSLPRQADVPPTVNPHARGGPANAYSAQAYIPAHQAPFAQRPAWHGYRERQAPSIYAPPGTLHYPPQVGPNGMIYSHSAPVDPRQYYNGGPYSHARDAGRGRDPASHNRGRSLSFNRPVTRINRSPSLSSSASRESGRTYYVHPPTGGPKVHIITPSPQPSIATATSTTRSPASARFGPFKKAPFLQRIFHFAKLSSVAPSRTLSTASSGKKIHRRHSTGGSGRVPVRVDQESE